MAANAELDWFGKHLLAIKAIVDSPPPHQTPWSDNGTDNGLLTPSPSDDGYATVLPLSAADVSLLTPQSAQTPGRHGLASPRQSHSTRRGKIKATEFGAKRAVRRENRDSQGPAMGRQLFKVIKESDIAPMLHPHSIPDRLRLNLFKPTPSTTAISKRTRSHTRTSNHPFCRLGYVLEIIVERANGVSPPCRQSWLLDGAETYRVQRRKRQKARWASESLSPIIDDSYWSVLLGLEPEASCFDPDVEAAMEMPCTDMASPEFSISLG